ncbi:DUF4265 domain-containing protein [Mariniluteicoccus flavus]
MTHLWIALEQDDDGYPPFVEEELHATAVGPDLYRIDRAPAFAYGIAVGDVVATTTTEDGRVWATSVAVEGDHWCARVVPLGGVEMGRVVKVFTSMGVNASATDYGVVTLDVPAGVEVEHVLAELRAGRDEGDWDFDVGVEGRG